MNVAVSVAVILIFAGVMIVWKVAESKTLLPDHAPTDVEENAVIDNADSEKMELSVTSDNDGFGRNTKMVYSCLMKRFNRSD